MDLRSGVKISSLVLKMIVRQASLSVDACEGSCYLVFRCIDVFFSRPTGHYVRDNYSVLLNMAPAYHIVVVRVILTSCAYVWRLHFPFLETGYDTDLLFDNCHYFIFCLLALGCMIILLKTKLYKYLDHN
jgi:hypothetical protein